MTDRWTGLIWTALAAAILGVFVAAGVNGHAPSTKLLVTLAVVLLVATVAVRVSRSRKTRAVPELHESVTELRSPRSDDDPAPFPSNPPGVSRVIAGEPDWEVFGSICVALDIRQLEWLRTNDFATPWLDGRVRPAIELEPLVAAAVGQSFEWELRAALQVLLDAIKPFVALYNESTAPDPLLLGEEWWFFEREDVATEAESGAGEESWHGRATRLHHLAVQVVDAYAQLVSVASRDPVTGQQIELPVGRFA